MLPEVVSAFENQQLNAVRANILLLIGELVAQLKIRALPSLPRAVPVVIDVLQEPETVSG